MAITNHTLYDNEVIEQKVSNKINTAVDVFPLMKVDKSLETAPGMKKVIHTYVYDGASEKLARGQGNTTGGVVTMTPVEHTVLLSQQKFVYYDEDVMKDPMVVDTGVDGLGVSMSNEMKADFFAAIDTTTTKVEYTTAFNYEVVVDGIEAMNVEDETGLFIIITPTEKAAARKDPNFKAVAQGEIITSGHMGFMSGLPVVVSKICKTPVICTAEAVTCFLKKQSEIEQARNADTRENTIFGRRVHLVALTNATQAVKLVKKSA